MSATTIVAISIAVALAGFVQGSTGVGFALIVAPVLGLLAPQWLPVVVLVLMLPLNLYVVWRERAALDWRSGTWITLGRFAGTFGGLWVLVVLSASHLNLLIGISTIVAAVVTLAMPVFRPVRSVYVAAGMITGVTETATGIGGPPLALVYQHHPVAAMRSTIALCFLIGELMSLVLLWHTGRVDPQQLADAAPLLPALLLGAGLSQLVHHRVNASALRTFVMLFSIASGVLLLARA